MVIGGFLRPPAEAREQLVEDREDLGRARDATHGEVLVAVRDLLVAVPHDGLAGADPLADLDVGEVLADGQQLLLDELEAVPHVVGNVVAVGGLGGVDVPVLGRIAVAHDVVHLLERRRDDGAAGLHAAEERLLVDLARRARMAHEDDVDLAIVPREEDVQQHEEALGQVLQRLGHGGRRVHEAEHDGLRRGLRHALEAVVLQVERIDVGDRAPQRDQALQARLSSAMWISSRGVSASASASCARARGRRSSFGRRSAMRRARLRRMVRTRLSFAGGPSVV